MSRRRVRSRLATRRRAIARRIRRRRRAVMVILSAHLAELLTAAAMIAGWLLITLGIAARVAPAVVWPVSLGLLCCSLGGWQLLYTIARYGLYALHQDKS